MRFVFDGSRYWEAEMVGRRYSVGIRLEYHVIAQPFMKLGLLGPDSKKWAPTIPLFLGEITIWIFS